jgi:hypothetical protein
MVKLHGSPTYDAKMLQPFSIKSPLCFGAHLKGPIFLELVCQVNRTRRPNGQLLNTEYEYNRLNRSGANGANGHPLHTYIWHTKNEVSYAAKAGASKSCKFVIILTTLPHTDLYNV